MIDQTAVPVPHQHDLRRLFDPRSIAIVGASGNPSSMTARPLEYLVGSGFTGDIYPVNPRYNEISGITTYPSLAAIGADVDLVLIFVPAADVIGVVEQCRQVNASVAVVFSSGFSETGPEGATLQAELTAAAARASVRLIGPNCQGFTYAPTGVIATFSPSAAAGVRDQGFAFVGQSGALGGYLMGLARESGLGMTAWVSTGNEADCSSTEIAAALVERDEIKVVALYLESINDAAGLARLAERSAALQKPVVILLAGQTASGWQAAVSHTGAMVRPGASFLTWAKKVGFVVVDDLAALHDTSLTLLANHREQGRRIVAVTTSGGAGSLIADHVERAGLVLAAVPATLRTELSKVIPDFGSIDNPIDVTAQLFRDGTMDAFNKIVSTIADEPGFDQVIVAVTSLGGDLGVAFAEAVAKMDVGAPVHVCWLAAREFGAGGRSVMRDHGLPVYNSITEAVNAAALLADAPVKEVHRWTITGDARFDDLPDLVTEADSTKVLEAAGVPQPRSTLVTTPGEATAAVEAVGGRAVLKLQSPDVLHKSDKGLVRLHVTTTDAAEVARELLAAGGKSAVGVLVQQQLDSGFELLVSVRSEIPGLPPLLTVGYGGVQAEIWQDVATHPLPVSRCDVEALLGSLRSSRLLSGYRGDPGYDVPAAVGTILAIVRAAELLGGRLRELEVNPVIVQRPGGGAHAADALIHLSSERGE